MLTPGTGQKKTRKKKPTTMKSHTKHNLWQGTSPPWHPFFFFPDIKLSSSAQIWEGRAPSSTLVNHLLFLEGLRGSSGLTLQHRFHPLGAAGAGRADGELLQRHSRDSAGAGKSQQRSSQAGRCSATHCSSFWRVANVQSLGKVVLGSSMLQNGAGSTSAAVEVFYF